MEPKSTKEDSQSCCHPTCHISSGLLQYHWVSNLVSLKKKKKVDSVSMPSPISSLPAELLSMVLSLWSGHLSNENWIVTTSSFYTSHRTAGRWRRVLAILQVQYGLYSALEMANMEFFHQVPQRECFQKPRLFSNLCEGRKRLEER